MTLDAMSFCACVSSFKNSFSASCSNATLYTDSCFLEYLFEGDDGRNAGFEVVDSLVSNHLIEFVKIEFDRFFDQSGTGLVELVCVVIKCLHHVFFESDVYGLLHESAFWIL